MQILDMFCRGQGDHGLSNSTNGHRPTSLDRPTWMSRKLFCGLQGRHHPWPCSLQDCWELCSVLEALSIPQDLGLADDLGTMFYVRTCALGLEGQRDKHYGSGLHLDVISKGMGLNSNLSVSVSNSSGYSSTIRQIKYPLFYFTIIVIYIYCGR